jgi:glycosyltransferase involved in cell wall biosynthesis
MLKVLYVIPELRRGGAERLVIDICTEINKRNDVTAMIAVFRDKNLYSELTGNIPVKTCHSKVALSILGNSYSDLGDFENVIETFRPNIIHSHLFEAEIVSREKLFKGVKYFTHCHDNMPQFRKFSASTLLSKRRITDFYEKRHLAGKYLQCTNNFIAISEDTKTYFEAMLPRSLKRNITLLHNAINFNLFNSVNRKRELSRVRIINVGSFVKKKNQRMLIDIGENLKKRGIETEITMVGDGPLRAEIQSEINRRGLEDMFSLPGSVNHVEDFYAKANIYVHTATYEPFGLVLLEAMASGLPVITLDGKGNRGLVQDKINGFFIRQEDPDVFAEDIILTVAEEKEYVQLSQNAVEFSAGFDISNYVDKLIGLYQLKQAAS